MAIIRPIEQACVILGRSNNKDTARQFLSFLRTAAAGELLRSYGFDVPAVKAAE